MKHFKKIVLLASILLLVSCQSKEDTKLNIAQILQSSESQLTYQLQLSDSLRTDTHTSPRTIEGDSMRMSRMIEWTSGFFPGNLWLMYELTGQDKWKTAAVDYTTKLEPMQYNKRTHDLGFMMYCSYGQAYRIIKEESYKDVLLQSANSLISRFNPTVGCIRSWDHSTSRWAYPVIIDNMMNLELLYWASKISGDNKYKEVANIHAMTTLKNHFRSDYSSYHVIDYDVNTGEVLQRNTAQGYADESAWARGQAWALYGYTMCYRETGIPTYLEQAQHVADFIINNKNTPSDLIPYWDYDVPNKEGQPRDASAAAIYASALIDLAAYADNTSYLSYAKSLMKSLSTSEYMAQPKTNWGFILKHSTGSIPHNSEIDKPLVYADYYFLEALLKLKELNN